MLHHRRHRWLNSSSKNTISGNIDLLSVWKIWCLWEWGQVPGLEWGVTELNGSQHLGQPLMIGKGKQWKYDVTIHEHPCSVNSNMYGCVWHDTEIFFYFFFLPCRISIAQLPTCHPQSEWLLSQSFQAYWCMKFIYFTPPPRLHLKSVAIQLWWEDSWYVAACSKFRKELCTPEGNIGRNKCKVSRITSVYSVVSGIEMNNTTVCVCMCVCVVLMPTAGNRG